MKQTRLPRQVQLVQRQIQRWQSPPCPHVPNSSFFNIPPHISLALVTSLLNKFQLLLQLSHQFISCTLECNFWTPYLLSLSYSKSFSLLIHACTMSSSGLISSVYTPFSSPSLSAHAGAADPIAVSRCPLIYSIEGAHFSTTSSQYDR
jgi:hypothetical protein